MKFIILLSLLLIFLSSCDIISPKKQGREYIISLNNTTGVPIDSISLTSQTEGVKLQSLYTRETMTITGGDAGTSKIQLSIPLEGSDTSVIHISYVCYVHDIPILTSDGSFQINGTTIEKNTDIDTLAITIMKEYQSLLTGSDSVNSLLFDSLFIDFSLREVATPHHYYTLYRNRSISDTLGYLAALIDTIEGRDSLTVITRMHQVLPETLDPIAILDNTTQDSLMAERMIVRLAFDTQLKTEYSVVAQLNIASDSSSLIKHMEFQAEDSTYFCYINLYSLSDIYDLEINVYDSLNRKVGYAQNIFSTYSYNIQVPSFDPNNARPWIAIDSLSLIPGNGNTDIHVMLSYNDSLGNGEITSLEWKLNDGNYTQVDSLTNLITILVPTRSAYTIYTRVTDNDNNSAVDSSQIVLSP